MEMNSHFVKVNAEYRFAEHRVAKRERERERERERGERKTNEISCMRDCINLTNSLTPRETKWKRYISREYRNKYLNNFISIFFC
jgi:hypothetical protein